MTAEKANEMFRLWQSGWTHQKIADHYGMSRTTVYNTIQRVINDQPSWQYSRRGKKLDIDKIKYRRIYEHFINHPEETCTSLALKVYGYASAASIEGIRHCMYKKHNVHFTLDQTRNLCEAIGVTFEELLEER